MDMPASLPFSKAFDFASGAIGDRFQNPFWKIKEYFGGASLRQAIFEVKGFGNTIVSTAVRTRFKNSFRIESDHENVTSSLRTKLIDSLLDHMKDHSVVADAAMNYLSAGMLVVLILSLSNMPRR